jgi:hypothetical protein
VELSWLMRLRIAAAVATGVILIGILAWPLAVPPEPLDAVRTVSISFTGKVTLMTLALFAGFIAYFVSWPYGREIGILAAPSGLAVWAGRSGCMATLMQLNPTLPQRQALFASLKWEAIFWLFVVAAGFAGVLAAQKIVSNPPAADSDKEQDKPSSRPNMFLNAAIALAGSVLISQFFIGIFAQDVRCPDSQSGSVVGQPAIGQIIFAVLVSFGLVAFAAKAFLDVSYIWPSIASGLVTALGITLYAKQNLLEHLLESWPATFFSNSVISILPIQMVAFGTLGSIAGYWLAIRYSFWRKSEV